MPAPKFVIYNGVQVITGWPERIEDAQTTPTVSIGGREYPRIRYGDERDDWGADQHPCHDCAAIKGQLHVIGCDGECCPCCGDQVLSCECPYDTDERESE